MKKGKFKLLTTSAQITKKAIKKIYYSTDNSYLYSITNICFNLLPGNLQNVVNALGDEAGGELINILCNESKDKNKFFSSKREKSRIFLYRAGKMITSVEWPEKSYFPEKLPPVINESEPPPCVKTEECY